MNFSGPVVSMREMRCPVDQYGGELLPVPVEYIDAAVVLLNAPDVVHIEAEQSAGEDFDHDLMRDESEAFAIVIGQSFVQCRQRKRSHCFQASSRRDFDRVRSCVPQVEQIRRNVSHLGWCQTLPLAIIDVDESGQHVWG